MYCTVNLEQAGGGLHLSKKSVRWTSYSNNILCTYFYFINCYWVISRPVNHNLIKEA
jgi:hypothetical protein